MHLWDPEILTIISQSLADTGVTKTFFKSGVSAIKAHLIMSFSCRPKNKKNN